MALYRDGKGDAATAPHLGASRTGLTLSTIQTTEALRSRREKSVGVRRGTPVRLGSPSPKPCRHGREEGLTL